jgi:dienelactone hydrolase
MTYAAATEIVTFKRKDQSMVTAKLTKPQDKGPFTAIILLHGCLGFDKHYNVWAERLGTWGYVAMQLDSFGPSGKLSICNLPSERAQNLCDAKSYLSGLPFVDPKRIGVMAWSQAGALTLASLCARLSAQRQENPFRVAVAFYPYCFKPLVEMNMPLLVLVGELDDWCPSGLWREKIPLRKARHEVSLKVYPGAYHCFDWEGVNTNYMGHRLQYCPRAAADAIIQVKEFLAKHLK